GAARASARAGGGPRTPPPGGPARSAQGRRPRPHGALDPGGAKGYRPPGSHLGPGACCRSITGAQSFRNGACKGGFLRHVNVTARKSASALPSGGAVPVGSVPVGSCPSGTGPGSIEVRG